MRIDELKSLIMSGEPAPSGEDTFNAVLVLFKSFCARPEAASSGSSTAPHEQWLTLAEAAEYAAVSIDTLRSWISDGLIKVGRVRKVTRIRRSDIDSLLTGEVNESSTSEAKDVPERIGTPVSSMSSSILTSLRSPSSQKKRSKKR